ncbi:hypothetical protein PLICRDRAFT_174836 [Plicaturopsis crispa FD-325 SS-3]|nr:hypothetical protein PLICRDRAFT_174836 [Plicaturopsis crispa FD-325 SS-3]
MSTFKAGVQAGCKPPPARRPAAPLLPRPRTRTSATPSIVHVHCAPHRARPLGFQPHTSTAPALHPACPPLHPSSRPSAGPSTMHVYRARPLRHCALHPAHPLPPPPCTSAVPFVADKLGGTPRTSTPSLPVILNRNPTGHSSRSAWLQPRDTAARVKPAHFTAGSGGGRLVVVDLPLPPPPSALLHPQQITPGPPSRATAGPPSRALQARAREMTTTRRDACWRLVVVAFPAFLQPQHPPCTRRLAQAARPWTRDNDDETRRQQASRRCRFPPPPPPFSTLSTHHRPTVSPALRPSARETATTK